MGFSLFQNPETRDIITDQMHSLNRLKIAEIDVVVVVDCAVLSRVKKMISVNTVAEL